MTNSDEEMSDPTRRTVIKVGAAVAAVAAAPAVPGAAVAAPGTSGAGTAPVSL